MARGDVHIHLTVEVPVIASKQDLIEAFTEWDREYREDPEAFESTLACIAKGKTSEDYGHGATRTLEAYLAKVRQRRDDANYCTPVSWPVER